MKLAAIALAAAAAAGPSAEPDALLLPPGTVAEVACSAPSGCVVVPAEVLEAALRAAAASCRRGGWRDT